MTENVAKLVGVAAMAALVVVGVVVSSGDDTDYTRNTAFEVPKLGGDLNDQVQQPGDAEELASRAIAAAAKCEETPPWTQPQRFSDERDRRSWPKMIYEQFRVERCGLGLGRALPCRAEHSRAQHRVRAPGCG